MPSYAVTGASRGLGLELVNQLSSSPSNIVFALVRNTTGSSKLTALSATRPNLHILAGDITSLPQLEEAAKQISAITSGALDVLINNAAFIDTTTASLLPSALTTPSNLAPFIEQFNNSMETNVLAAVYVTNAFLPLILAGKEKKIIHLSSGMAVEELITRTGLAYSIPYSASKAALNIVVAKFAAELKEKGVAILALSPGWVDTEEGPVTEQSKAATAFMLGFFRKLEPTLQGKLQAEDSVRMQLEVIQNLKIEDSGKMLSHHGNLDWF